MSRSERKHSSRRRDTSDARDSSRGRSASSTSSTYSSRSTSGTSGSHASSHATTGSEYARKRGTSRSQSGAEAYSRYSTTSDRSTGRRITQRDYTRERKRRKRKRNALIAVAIVAVLVLGVGGVGLAYYATISGNLSAGLDSDLSDVLVDTELTEEPFYVLLLGVDSSEARDESGNYDDTYRSDSIMLARIDPVDKKVTLVSIHRDTLVDMGEYGQQKLNAAHALGGASLSVEMVSELAGVDISHYAEINFDGFEAIVDALGGIEVDVPVEIDDEDAGGHLDAGLQTLDGEQALILCRSRHTYDDYGDGDSYRAANQRLVLSAIAEKLLDSDVATIASVVTTLSEYVTTDMSVNDIIGVAQAMQGLDADTDIYTGMEPTTSSYINGIWYEINDTEEWTEMMERVDAGLPPTEEDEVDESTGTVLASTGSGDIDTDEETELKEGTVSVRNGNGTTGAAEEAAEILEELGYDVDTDNADAFDYAETLVIYNEESQAEEAQEIVDELGVGTAMMNDGTYVVTDGYLVVLGADWGS